MLSCDLKLGSDILDSADYPGSMMVFLPQIDIAAAYTGAVVVGGQGRYDAAQKASGCTCK